MSKKVPTDIDRALFIVNTLSLSDVFHYGNLIRDAVDRRQRMWWGSDEQKAEQEARNAKSVARKVSQAKLAAKRIEWVEANLKPGMVVKMSGTRDGHGVRYVVGVDRGTVICRQMAPTHRLGRSIDEMKEAYPHKSWIPVAVPSDTGKYSIWEITNAGTDHGIDKVVGVFSQNEAGLYAYEAIK